MIKLGQEVKDLVSGFTGIAVAKDEWLNGCLRYGIQGKVDKEGKLPDPKWIDAVQLEIIGEGIFVVKKKTGMQNPSGPRSYKKSSYDK